MVLLGIVRNKEMVMTTTAEKKLVYNKKYREKYPERVLESAKKYRDNNKDKVRAAVKNWRENNSEKVREYNRKYNDKKCIEKECAEWNDTLRELGYADLINA
jgi:phosphoribosylformimino-5-aminoimidazole carboxamide ribonucleotide (ProFAR) isomerase